MRMRIASGAFVLCLFLWKCCRHTKKLSYVITGISGPRGYKDPISDAAALRTLRNVLSLAEELDADVAIVGAATQFERAMSIMMCTRCHFELDVSRGGSRLAKIAAARNQLLRYVKRMKYDVWIQTDLDGTCTIDPGAMRTLETHPEFDIVTFTPDTQNYWDRWALRSEWHPHNLFGPKRNELVSANEVNDIVQEARQRGRILHVDSAFMMLAVYRMSTLSRSDCVYGWEGAFGETDCEHAVFHKCLRKDVNVSVVISPVNYCVG